MSQQVELNVEAVTDLFCGLYSFASHVDDPMPPYYERAFKAFISCFTWLCPSLRYPATDAEESAFMCVATQHERICPATFKGEKIVDKYLGHDLPPTVWGPPLWALLHRLAEHGDRELLKRALLSLVTLLPCPSCRSHLAAMLSQYSIPDDPAQLPAFMIFIHNLVNIRLGKPVWSPKTPV